MGVSIWGVKVRALRFRIMEFRNLWIGVLNLWAGFDVRIIVLRFEV